MFVPEKLFNLTRDEVYTNARKKINPLTGEVIEDAVSSRAIFKAVAADARGEVSSRGSGLDSESAGDGADRSAVRARKQLFELAVCNQFDLFVTLTLDSAQVDRYDYKVVINKLRQWLDNLVRRHGFAYLLVPERHKDGAIHFHGLVREAGLKLADSGHRDKSGRMIYNILNWRLGFTTAVRLDGDYGNICRYITKYIGKDVGKAGTIGGRYYYHNAGLTKPRCVYYNTPFEEAEGFTVEVKEGGFKICYLSK